MVAGAGGGASLVVVLPVGEVDNAAAWVAVAVGATAAGVAVGGTEVGVAVGGAAVGVAVGAATVGAATVGAGRVPLFVVPSLAVESFKPGAFANGGAEVGVGGTAADVAVAVGGRVVGVAVGTIAGTVGVGVGNTPDVAAGVSPAGGRLVFVLLSAVGWSGGSVGVAVGRIDVAVVVAVATGAWVLVGVDVAVAVVLGTGSGVLVAVATGGVVAVPVLVATGTFVDVAVGRAVDVGSGVALLVAVGFGVALLVGVSDGVGDGTRKRIGGPSCGCGVLFSGVAVAVGAGLEVGGSTGATKLIGAVVSVGEGAAVGRRVGVFVAVVGAPDPLPGVQVAVAPPGGMMIPDCSAGVGTGVLTGGPTSICAALADATTSPASLTATTSTAKRPIVLTGVLAIHVPSVETVAVTTAWCSTKTCTDEPVGP